MQQDLYSQRQNASHYLIISIMNYLNIFSILQTKYRSMKYCPKCNSGQIVKSGIIHDCQRYKCKNCNYHFTVGQRGLPARYKRMAIHLWLEGLSIRNVGRILNISAVATGKWVNPVKDELAKYRKPKITSKELHSVEHFMITKNMFQQYGWLVIGLEENEEICLLGTTETRNCSIKELEK